MRDPPIHLRVAHREDGFYVERGYLVGADLVWVPFVVFASPEDAGKCFFDELREFQTTADLSADTDDIEVEVDTDDL